MKRPLIGRIHTTNEHMVATPNHNEARTTVMKHHHASMLALLISAATYSATAISQSVWPKEYEQYSRPYQPPTAAEDQQARRNTDPNLRTWRPFECQAPLSNYHQARSEAEMLSCITAHDRVFRAIYNLYPEGIGYSGPLKWTISVNPRGTVSTALASAPGAPSQTYISTMRTMFLNIHFGNCTSCRTASAVYTIDIPR